MSKRPTPTLLAALAVLALLIAGCGGDEGGSTEAGGQGDAGSTAAESGSSTQGSSADSAEEPASKAEFVKEANRICLATVRAVTSKTFPVVEEAQKEPDYDRETVEAKLVTEVMAPELHKEAQKLRALGAPAGDEEEVDAIVASIEKLATRAEKEADELVKYSSNAMIKVARQARRYGLGSCPYG